MIVLTPNPCFDEIILVPALQAGNVHRALKNETSAGGKGINVVRAVGSLGGNSILILMLPKIQSDLYKSLLVSENIKANFLEIEGQSRRFFLCQRDPERHGLLAQKIRGRDRRRRGGQICTSTPTPLRILAVLAELDSPLHLTNLVPLSHDCSQLRVSARKH